MINKQIILASSSIYRKELLEELHLPFSYINPDIDEQIHREETPKSAIIRLATEKADDNDFNSLICLPLKN